METRMQSDFEKKYERIEDLTPSEIARMGLTTMDEALALKIKTSQTVTGQPTPQAFQNRQKTSLNKVQRIFH
jgi:hypothetical protein